MTQFTTDNIDQVRASPGVAPGQWRISFASSTAGMCHQLYVDGQLADFSDSPDCRSFVMQARGGPCRVAVAAVDFALRSSDMSALVAAMGLGSDWVFRTSVVRSPRYPRSARVALLGDHATGRIDERPLDCRAIWPDSQPRWAWGEDRFGVGGFGLDGASAPGAGLGAFGGGLFGVDEGVIVLSAPLYEEGTHSLVLRTILPDGSCGDTPLGLVFADPPPGPPSSLRIARYDSQTDTLTLEIT